MLCFVFVSEDTYIPDLRKDVVVLACCVSPVCLASVMLLKKLRDDVVAGSCLLPGLTDTFSLGTTVVFFVVVVFCTVAVRLVVVAFTAVVGFLAFNAAIQSVGFFGFNRDSVVVVIVVACIVGLEDGFIVVVIVVVFIVGLGAGVVTAINFIVGLGVVVAVVAIVVCFVVCLGVGFTVVVVVVGFVVGLGVALVVGKTCVGLRVALVVVWWGGWGTRSSGLGYAGASMITVAEAGLGLAGGMGETTRVLLNAPGFLITDPHTFNDGFAVVSGCPE